MIKFIIGLLFVVYLVSYYGGNTYKDVETISDLASLINVYLTSTTAITLMTFGIDEIRR